MKFANDEERKAYARQKEMEHRWKLVQLGQIRPHVPVMTMEELQELARDLMVFCGDTEKPTTEAEWNIQCALYMRINHIDDRPLRAMAEAALGPDADCAEWVDREVYRAIAQVYPELKKACNHCRKNNLG